MSSATVEAQVIPPLVKQGADNGRSPNEMADILISAFDRAYEGQGASRDLQVGRFNLAGRVGRVALMKEEGGCVTSTAAAKLYLGDNPTKTPQPETVRKAARESRLIAIRDGHGDLLFPIWQFAAEGGSLPGLAKVIKELAQRPGYSEITPLRFFLQHHPRTGGRPLDTLRSGQIEAVVAAAVAERD